MDAANADALLDYLGVDAYGRIKRGAEYNFRCPLHKDSKASASINLMSSLWICSANCGAGPVPDLIVKVHGVKWKRAKEIFQQFGGSALGWDDLRILSGVGVKPPVKRTWLTETQLEALPYDMTLQSRGISAETTKHFGIRWFERYKCLIIPYYDRHGHYVAHTFRRAQGAAFRHGKPHGTEPSEHLFGLLEAGWSVKKQRFEQSPVILVEGPVDAMRMHQEGFHSTVALFGSKLSEAQARIVRRSRFVWAFLDFDWAGIKGLWSILKRLGNSSPVMLMPYVEAAWGSDPGDVSSEEIKRSIAARTPLTNASIQALSRRAKMMQQFA